METAERIYDLTWLESAERDGTSVDTALAAFDAGDPVRADELTGRWKGGGLATGHPMDGLLEAFGWYGKEFRDTETVHPLLFARGEKIVAIDPKSIPVGAAASQGVPTGKLAVAAAQAGMKLLETTRPAARLRMTEYRGVSTATMIYDAKPINDMFRAIAPGVLIGIMDARGVPPFFFTLRHVGAAQIVDG